MRRIKLVLAALAVAVAAFVAVSSPVMAQTEVLYDAEGNAFSCTWVDTNADTVLELVCVPQTAPSSPGTARGAGAL